MKKRTSCIMIILTIIMFLSYLGQAATVEYIASNLSDVNIGEDLWQYTYSVKDYTFNINEGFDIYYTLGSYKNIAPISNSSQWNILAFQPDQSLTADGVYDALALINSADLTKPFIVNFVWLGQGTPGPQPYEVFNSNFEIVTSGQTAAVPIPGSVWLLGTSLLTLIACRKKTCN